MKRRYIISLFILAILAQNCAKQTAPTGGPKDETPPTLTKSDPKNQQTNFTGTSIELTFDELVQLNNPKEQIIITPSIGKKFNAVAKKNKVVLDFNTELQPNTTYNINFRESIQDLNEKNPTQVKLALSTGTHIDSLSISGKIKDALTDKEVKNYTIALAPASDTFNIFKHSALWLTLTDDQGNFTIENLKAGEYILYAFDDKSKNLIVDSKTEKYGFLPNVISLTESIKDINFTTFKQDITPLKLIIARPTFTYFQIKVSKGLKEYDIKSENKQIVSALDPDNNTIRIYNTIGLTDSLQIHLSAVDSTGSKIDSALYLKFNEKKFTKEKFSYKVEENNIEQSQQTFKSIIKFSKPVLSFRYDSIRLQLDSVSTIDFSENDFTWNNLNNHLTIHKKIDYKESSSAPLLKMPKGTFISAELDTADNISQTTRILKPENTGVIISKVETNENFILQLLNKNYEVVKEVANVKNYNFENLNPESFKLRLIIDLNKNGKWDAGDINNKTSPEPVLYYSNSKKEKDINLKANWELGPLLITF